MNMKLIWKDVFASKTENGLDVHFVKLGNDFYSLYQTLQANPDVHFSLTPSQQLQFNQFFEKMQTLYVNIQEEEIISSVRRLGLIAFRIMMIFSALRIMEDGNIEQIIYCNDTDFQNTLDMITILVKHSSYVYSQIAQETYKPKPKHKKEQFLENLPYHFNRQTYVATALSLGITDKSAQRYIKEFKDADIIQYDGHDQYTNPNAKNPQ
jgi:AAA+ ATPase superfamily predicted ATPase